SLAPAATSFPSACCTRQSAPEMRWIRVRAIPVPRKLRSRSPCRALARGAVAKRHRTSPPSSRHQPPAGPDVRVPVVAPCVLLPLAGPPSPLTTPIRESHLVIPPVGFAGRHDEHVHRHLRRRAAPCEPEAVGHDRGTTAAQDA